jgi:uncharacterized SAM-binding protein YcdF (DUF218 family)
VLLLLLRALEVLRVLRRQHLVLLLLLLILLLLLLLLLLVIVLLLLYSIRAVLLRASVLPHAAVACCTVLAVCSSVGITDVAVHIAAAATATDSIAMRLLLVLLPL